MGTVVVDVVAVTGIALVIAAFLLLLFLGVVELRRCVRVLDQLNTNYANVEAQRLVYDRDAHLRADEEWRRR